MTTANKELCQELYELTGWETNDNLYWVQSKNGGDFLASTQVGGDFPAYTAGYLLRKLPPMLGEDSLCMCAILPTEKVQWTAAYTDDEPDSGGRYAVAADTPEDVLCKLAIILWKEGVLHD